MQWLHEVFDVHLSQGRIQSMQIFDVELETFTVILYWFWRQVFEQSPFVK